MNDYAGWRGILLSPASFSKPWRLDSQRFYFIWFFTAYFFLFIMPLTFSLVSFLMDSSCLR